MSFLKFSFLIFCSVLLCSCASSDSSKAISSDSLTHSETAHSSATFTLSAGDRVRITVFGDESLSGEYDIDGNGNITMPLIGEMAVGGHSVTDLQTQIIERLNAGQYLVNPRVSIEVISLRPFYIRGEVRLPGSYPTFPDFDVFKAIATAGGLTPRAVKGKYIIYRGTRENRREIAADDATPVFPGDSIRVKERFF